jgi:hypothetical protein
MFPICLLILDYAQRINPYIKVTQASCDSDRILERFGKTRGGYIQQAAVNVLREKSSEFLLSPTMA